jgi:hypothetical protein
MKQKVHQSTKDSSGTAVGRIQINVSLSGEDAKRFERYQNSQKFRQKGPAAYKLMFERLDQIDEKAA